MVMSPFRRSIKADTKRTGGKGGGRRSFFERFRLPVGTPTPFVLINAEYLDPAPSQDEVELDPATGRPREVKKAYFKVRKHKRNVVINGRQRYPESVCSAGFNPHNPQPCAGCAAMDQGDKSVTVGDLAVFGIVHLAVYHRHPLIDQKTGGYIVKQQQGQQQGGQGSLVMVDDECTGRSCNFCRLLAGQPLVQDPNARTPFPNYNPRDIQTVFGKRRFMELGKNHLMNLEAWDSTVSSLCGNDGSQLITDGFKCPHCQSLVIDMNQDTRTDQQIQEAVAKPYPCMRCGRPVLLEEVIACEVCEQAQRQPRQFTVFDRVLWGMRQGEGTASQLVLHRHEGVEEFEQRLVQSNPQLLQGKSLRALIADIGKPYDFSKVFEPRSIGDQLKDLELSGQQGVQQQMMPGYGGGAYGQAPGQQPMQPGYSQPMPSGYGQPPAPGYGQVQPPGGPAASPGPAAPGPMMRPNFSQGGNQ